MRIALIRGTLLGAWELPNYELADADVTAFVTPGDLARLSSPRVRLRALRSVAELARGLSPRVSGGLEYVGGSLEYLLGLERALRGFDVAHALELGNPITEQAIRAARRGACRRVVATVMENIPFHPDQNAWVRARVLRVARSIDHCVAITERARLHLELWGVPPERITVLPLGVDLEHFRPADTPLAGDPALRVLCVARLVPAKGVEDLVVAAGLLRDRGVAVEVTFAGQGPLRARLKWIAARLGVAERVRFAGGVPWRETAGLYREHDVFVLASAPTRTWREQFGFAVIEAMASGLPVLVGESGSLPEVVGGPPSLVRPHDPVALADALEGLAIDPARRRELGAANRGRALERYDERRIRTQLGALYARVLAEPPAASVA